jgi:hypothetical protein
MRGNFIGRDRKQSATELAVILIIVEDQRQPRGDRALS